MQLDATFFPQRSVAELHKQVMNEVGEGMLGEQAAFSVGIGRSLGVKLGQEYEFRLSSTTTGIQLDEKAEELKKNDYHAYVPGPRAFKEIEWTIDELPAFKIFRIKLIMTSTNQAIVPVMQDLRAIALA